MDPGLRLPGFESQQLPLCSSGLWASGFSSLCLSFLIYKTGVINIPGLLGK